MFKDITSLKNRMPLHAEGHVCLDFKDPVTGKIVDQIKGKNYVFMDALLSGPGSDWISMVSGLWMCLMDDGSANDVNFPFLSGQTIAYGRPSLGTLNAYRGAYNSANQVLAKMDATKARWKFQYDFTTAQANSGTIRSVGLTNQFVGASLYEKYPLLKGFKAGGQVFPGYSYLTSDGRYRYTITTAGVITRYDDALYTRATIDVSTTTGTIAGNPKTVGYNPSDGTYYIYVYSSTASSRKMYKFSDNTFSTLLSTYSCDNFGTTFGASSGYPMYIYGNNAYWLSNSYFYKANFASNTAAGQLAYPNSSEYNKALTNEATTQSSYWYARTGAFNSKYIYMGRGSTGGAYSVCPIFDMSTDTFVAQVGDWSNTSQNDGAQTTSLYPIAENQLPCTLYNGNYYFTGAITRHVLAEPFKKTSANGMTATYELEVFW